MIDSTAMNVNTTITRTEREIELIQELGTTLISDAVTGKIDIRKRGGHG